ncbi:hypothetical protein [Clostridium akagii]|uniref:hypothetical protein n=1 Tax=Clostridium akagii TaxID=91623 RepID=UPI00047B025F|nr:hypothetical protein [Clostridium akagii]
MAIDFIKNCELSEDIINSLPKEDTIVLDYTKEKDIQGFSFNEFKIDSKISSFERLSLLR